MQQTAERTDPLVTAVHGLADAIRGTVPEPPAPRTLAVKPVDDAMLMGAALVRFPELLRQFDTTVPREYIGRDGAVQCTCGETHVFEALSLLAHGDCGRVFLRTDRGVRVAKWPPVEESPECGCENRRLLYEGWDGLAHCATCDGTVAPIKDAA